MWKVVRWVRPDRVLWDFKFRIFDLFSNNLRHDYWIKKLLKSNSLQIMSFVRNSRQLTEFLLKTRPSSTPTLKTLRAACVKTSIKTEIMWRTPFSRQQSFPTVPFKISFNRFHRLRFAIKTNDIVLRILSSFYSNRCQIGQRLWLMNGLEWCKGSISGGDQCPH